MLIEQVHILLADLEGSNLASTRPPEQVDRILHLIIVDLFNKYYDHYVKTQKISDFLLPFKRMQALTLTSGKVPIPGNYAHTRLVYLGDEVTEVGMVEDKFWPGRVSSKVDPPSATRPICRIENSEGSSPVPTLQVVPSSVPLVKMLMFKTPTAPKYGYTQEGTRYVFNEGTSIDLEFQIGLYPDIMIRLLNAFGIVLREGQLLEITERLKMQEQAK